MYKWIYIIIYFIAVMMLIFTTNKGKKSINNIRKRPYLCSTFMGFISCLISLFIIILEMTVGISFRVYINLDYISFASAMLMSYFWFIYLDHLQGKKIVESKKNMIIFSLPLAVFIFISLGINIYINLNITEYENLIPNISYTVFQLILICFYNIISATKSLICVKKNTIFREKFEHITLASYALYPFVFGLIQIAFPGYDLVSIGIVLAMVQVYFYVSSLENERDYVYSRLIPFSSLFLVLYFIDLDLDKFEIVSKNTYFKYNKFSKESNGKKIKKFNKAYNEYIENYVYYEDKALLRMVLSKEYILKNLNYEHPYFSCVYRQDFEGTIKWYKLYVALQSIAEDGLTNKILLAVMDVDDDMRKDIMQRKLIEDALEEAKRANQAKSVFLSNMSHDIRTPMNAIIGYTKIALDYKNDANKIDDCLNKISIASNHLLDLINNILDMSRIESGKLFIDESECDLNDIIQTTIKIITNSLNKKDISFTINNNIVHDNIIADKLKIQQILLNLLNNAIKYSKNKGIVDFTVNETILENDFSQYTFIVRDNGIGMEKEFLNYIFEPFEREKTTTESGIEGTGLGLPIVKNLIDFMGGEIAVDSVINQGSTFTVKLNFKVISNINYKSNIKKDYDFSGIKILIAEDNDFNYEISYELLNQFKFKIDRAKNGLEAYHMLLESKSNTYDLVLMDILMPIMNGYDATKIIRQIDDLEIANIPIIAMTANAFKEDIELAYLSGMNAHISKPIEIDKLLDTINSVLSKNKLN